MISSRTKNENYFGYLILELIMVSVVTFLGTAIIVFYSLGRSDARGKTNHLESTFGNPWIFSIICVTPALIGVCSLLYFRNRNYITGYLFDDSNSTLTLSYRGINNKVNREIQLNYTDIYTQQFSEKKFLFNQAYKGTRIVLEDKKLALDFVTNNFIWEKQPREKVHFLEELYRIESLL